MREGKREYLVTAEVKVREEGGRLGGEGEDEGEGDRRDGRVGESEKIFLTVSRGVLCDWEWPSPDTTTHSSWLLSQYQKHFLSCAHDIYTCHHLSPGA